MSFSKISTYSNWCYTDRLNDKDLRDGEVITIQFPDGHEEDHTVDVRRFSSSENDMGRYVSIPHSEARVTIEYHGLKTRISPVGLNARRKDIK